MIGVARQRFRIVAVLGRDGDADRAPIEIDEPSMKKGCETALMIADGELAQPFAIADPRQHDLELVAAEPPDQPGFADRALQPLRDLLEQRVADRMAERVVDRLEPVEVEQEQRGRGRYPIAAPASCRAMRACAGGWRDRSARRTARAA